MSALLKTFEQAKSEVQRAKEMAPPKDVEARAVGPDPDLRPPFYDHRGDLITTYKDIRRYQQAVVETYVSHKLYSKYEGYPADQMTGYAMKQEAMMLLHAQKQKGNIHPHASIERWLDHSNPKDVWLKWTRCPHEENDRLFPWVPHYDRGRMRYISLDEDQGIQWRGGIFIPDPKRVARDQIRKQLRPDILNHRGVVARTCRVSFKDARQNELLALQLLRSMVEHDDFKRYLKNGFINVRGDSGLVYQIRRGQHVINVWDNGVLIAGLCVYTPDVPPTDDVISRMLIIECDEPDIWRRARVSMKDRQRLPSFAAV